MSVRNQRILLLDLRPNYGGGNDLNQMPYNYTVEVTNRFKGLDLAGRVPEKLWMEVHNIVQEAVIKTILKKKKCKKVKKVVF